MGKAKKGDPKKDLEVLEILGDMDKLLVNKRGFDLLSNSSMKVLRKITLIAKRIAARADDLISVRHRQATNVSSCTKGKIKRGDENQLEFDFRGSKMIMVEDKTDE